MRLQLAHLKVYGCRVYVMTSEAQLKQKWLKKLDSCIHIGYLVGYISTNIYKVWIPQKGKILLTRDIIFDESVFFDGKAYQDLIILVQIDDFIIKTELPAVQMTNEAILEAAEEILDFTAQEIDIEDAIVVSDITEAINNKELDKELAIILIDELASAYLSLSSEEEVLGIHLSIGDSEGVGDQAEAGLVSEDDPEVRFEAFKIDCVPICKQGVVFVVRKCEEVVWIK